MEGRKANDIVILQYRHIMCTIVQPPIASNLITIHHLSEIFIQLKMQREFERKSKVESITRTSLAPRRFQYCKEIYDAVEICKAG